MKLFAHVTQKELTDCGAQVFPSLGQLFLTRQGNSAFHERWGITCANDWLSASKDCTELN
jgi:hypothetical protein